MIRKIPNIKKNSKIQNGSTLKKKQRTKVLLKAWFVVTRKKVIYFHSYIHVTPTTRYVRYDIKIYMTVINDFRGFFLFREVSSFTGLKYFINFHKTKTTTYGLNCVLNTPDYIFNKISFSLNRST